MPVKVAPHKSSGLIKGPGSKNLAQGNVMGPGSKATRKAKSMHRIEKSIIGIVLVILLQRIAPVLQVLMFFQGS